MTLPGFRSRLVLLLSVMLVLTGCSAGTSPEMRPWRIVASDAQGAIVVDGSTIRSFHRGSPTPVWTTEGSLNGIACATTCSTAFLTFADRDGLFLAHHGSVTHQDLPEIDGTVRVLLARRDSVVLVQATDRTARLLLWRDGLLSRLRELGGGSTIWHATSAAGTLFMLGERSATAVTIRFNGDVVEHRVLPPLPHGLICYDASKTGSTELPEPAFQALQKSLGDLSTCLVGPGNRWIGVSNYLTMGPENPDGKPSVAIAVADRSGAPSWKQTFHGERFDLSPDHGADLLVANDHGVEILETLTGKSVLRIKGIADAGYLAPDEIVTVTFSGEVRWKSY